MTITSIKYNENVQHAIPAWPEILEVYCYVPHGMGCYDSCYFTYRWDTIIGENRYSISRNFFWEGGSEKLEELEHFRQEVIAEFSQKAEKKNWRCVIKSIFRRLTSFIKPR